jgi:hypothetical protein
LASRELPSLFIYNLAGALFSADIKGEPEQEDQTHLWSSSRRWGWVVGWKLAGNAAMGAATTTTNLEWPWWCVGGWYFKNAPWTDP